MHRLDIILTLSIISSIVAQENHQTGSEMKNQFSHSKHCSLETIKNHILNKRKVKASTCKQQLSDQMLALEL